MESGHTPSRRHPEYWGGDIPWISVKDARGSHGGVIHDTEEHTNELGIENSSARLLPTNTVCLSRGGTVGYVFRLGRPMATSQGFANWICGPELLPEFLAYLLLRERNALDRFASGTTIQTIYYPDLKAFHVCLPPLPEQRRIVAILDDAFEGIAAAKVNAERNLRNAGEVFEARLARPFAEPPKEWASSTIGATMRFIDYRGKTPTKTTSGLRLITAKNVKMGRLLEEPAEYVAASTYKAWMTRGIPKKGDVLFTTEAPLANVAELDTDAKVVFAQRIIIMQPDSNVLHSPFVKYMLMSAPVQQRIHQQGTGATVKGIKSSLLKQIHIQFPRALSEQRRIAEMLTALEADSGELRAASERKLAALDELKASLLHQAFTGQL